MSGDRIIPRDITLPSGAVVTFYDPEDLSGADYRQAVTNMTAAVSNLGLDLTDGKVAESADAIRTAVMSNPAALTMGMDAAEGTAVMLIEAWDIGYTPKGTTYPPHEVPIPSVAGVDVLRALKVRDYQAVLAAIEPATTVLFGDNTPTPDDAGRPGTPTPPAAG